MNILKHRFTSLKADGTDATQVQPSHWNDGHNFTGGNAGDVLIRDPTDAAFGAKWSGHLSPVVSDSGTIHNWALPIGTAPAYVIWSGTANTLVTGIAAGVEGQRIIISNVTGYTISFSHNDPLSLTANRLVLFATSAPTPVALGGLITLIYAAGRWRIADHEQGAWLTQPFSAADYTAGGSMTWTVAAGQVQQATYRVSGRVLTWTLAIVGSTIGGTAHYALFRRVPGGFSVVPQYPDIFGFYNGGATGTGMHLHQSATQVTLFHDQGAVGTPWALGALDIRLTGMIDIA